MPKKNSSWGQNTKAVEARERIANQKREEQQTKKKNEDDEYWKDDDKLDGRKKDRKDKEQQKKQEALKRKQDAKKLLEEEETKNSAIAKKAVAPKKVTQSEIDKAKEQERKENELLLKQRENERKRITENPDMEEVNPNRKMAEILAEQGAVEARSLGDAIEVLDVDGGTDGANVDIHPEKRMKAAYQEFEDRTLPRLKAENSNLRLSQLKQILRKEWQKSPDNPMNKR